MGKPLNVIRIMVSKDAHGNRIERRWEELSYEEQEAARDQLTVRFLEAAGYTVLPDIGTEHDGARNREGEKMAK